MFVQKSFFRIKHSLASSYQWITRSFFKRIKRQDVESVKECGEKTALTLAGPKSLKTENSTKKKSINVCIIGGGRVPIYTATLLKQSNIIKSIRLIDLQNTLAGIVLDINHIDTSARVRSFRKAEIIEALDKVDIIALMDEAEAKLTNTNCITQFKAATSYTRKVTEQVVEYSSHALVAVFIRPVTAMLPMVSEIYNWAGCWDPNKIIGSVFNYSMKMDAVTGNFLNLNPELLSVPLAGGADSSTIIPLMSCAKPFNEFSNAQVDTLLEILRSADNEALCIESRGSALSAGSAAAKLILILAAGLTGSKTATTHAFVRSNLLSECRFFTNSIQIGQHGVLKNFGLPKVSSIEISLIDQAIPRINEYTRMAINAVHADRRYKLESL